MGDEDHGGVEPDERLARATRAARRRGGSSARRAAAGRDRRRARAPATRASARRRRTSRAAGRAARPRSRARAASRASSRARRSRPRARAAPAPPSSARSVSCAVVARRHRLPRAARSSSSSVDRGRARPTARTRAAIRPRSSGGRWSCSATRVPLSKTSFAAVVAGLAGEHPQQRRLAGAVRPGQREPLAPLDLERDAVEEEPAGELLAQLGSDHDGHVPSRKSDCCDATLLSAGWARLPLGRHTESRSRHWRRSGMWSRAVALALLLVSMAAGSTTKRDWRRRRRT